MSFSFNLIDQPWIPCQTMDGRSIELSLIDLFHKAQNIKQITSETPLTTIAILPPILATLHRVFGPANIREWRALWDRGAFLMEPINDYLERWYDRFDLFHLERPFYQWPDDRVSEKSILHIVHAMGNTGTLFVHDYDAAGVALSPSQATRQLITSQAFRTAGLSGLPEKFTDGPFTRGVLFFAEGDNLFETLLLNLVRYPNPHIMRHIGEDKPAWEMVNPFTPSRSEPFGYLDYLTWQSNRILLYPEETPDGVVVREMTVAPGMRLSELVIAPQKRYEKRIKKKKGEPDEETIGFQYFNSSKALWRDFHTLTALDNEAIRPPAIVEWLAELVVAGSLPAHKRYTLSAGGMLADQAKPIFYRQEALPLPSEILTNRYAEIELAIRLAEETAGSKLYGALRRLADCALQRGGERKVDSTDAKNLIQQWDAITLYWEQLEPYFWDFIDQLPGDPSNVLEDWKSIIKQTALEAFGVAAQQAGTDAGALKGRVAGERQLRGGLNKLLDMKEASNDNR